MKEKRKKNLFDSDEVLNNKNRIRNKPVNVKLKTFYWYKRYVNKWMIKDDILEKLKQLDSWRYEEVGEFDEFDHHSNDGQYLVFHQFVLARNRDDAFILQRLDWLSYV